MNSAFLSTIVAISAVFAILGLCLRIRFLKKKFARKSEALADEMDLVAKQRELVTRQGEIMARQQQDLECRRVDAEKMVTDAQKTIHRLEDECRFLRLELSRDYTELATILQSHGRGTPEGDAAEAVLRRIGCAYEYQEEVYDTVTEEVCVQRGTYCTAQASDGTCYAGCKDGELCLGAVWETHSRSELTKPRRVSVNRLNPLPPQPSGHLEV